MALRSASRSGRSSSATRLSGTATSSRTARSRRSCSSPSLASCPGIPPPTCERHTDVLRAAGYDSRMERNIENVDAWVVARIGELERANRRLWIGIGALFTTLASLVLAGGLFAAHFEVPAGVAAAPGGKLAVDELE